MKCLGVKLTASCEADQHCCVLGYVIKSSSPHTKEFSGKWGNPNYPTDTNPAPARAVPGEPQPHGLDVTSDESREAALQVSPSEWRWSQPTGVGNLHSQLVFTYSTCPWPSKVSHLYTSPGESGQATGMFQHTCFSLTFPRRIRCFWPFPTSFASIPL